MIIGINQIFIVLITQVSVDTGFCRNLATLH